MLDQISISDCKKYIQIICNKKSEIKDIKETILHIMPISKGSGIDKVYIDERDRDYPLSSIECLQIATFLTETTSNQMKFAALIDEPVSSRELFIGAVSSKGGEISYFNEKATALTWLLSEIADH